jgi:RNA-directed DNA polymerase
MQLDKQYIIRSPKHFYYSIGIPKERVDIVINSIDEYYYRKEEYKYDTKNGEKAIRVDNEGNPVLRVIYPSTGLLKNIQTRLLRNILSKINLPSYAFGSVKGGDNIKNARFHQGNKHFFLTDLKSYFDSISSKRVFNDLVSLGFSYEVSRIITMLTTYKGFLPQGTPTSPILSNIAFMNIGKDLLNICEKYNIKFSSYVDDLTFSSKKDFKEITPLIIESIRNNGFCISNKKTFYKTLDPEVTGIIVKKDKLLPGKKTAAKLSNIESLRPNQIESLNTYINRIVKA